MAVVEVTAVTKRYGDVVAVDDLSMRVRRGEIYALLGLNGAGKTTLIRMLLGMVRPTAGSVSILGTAVGGDTRSVWSRVGYLVETPAAYPELTVRENLDVVARLRRFRGSVDDIIEHLTLEPFADRRARTLSLGNQQRLALAKALLHQPELLILDEPVNGLDPAGVVEIRSLLGDLARDHGTTVLLSSHLLAEVARLATRVGIIHQGRLLQERDADTLHEDVRRELVVVTRDHTAARTALAGAGFQVSGSSPIRLTGDRAVIRPDEVATILVNAGCPPTTLIVEEEDLESYFLRIVEADRA